MDAKRQNPPSRPKRYDKNDGTAEMVIGIMAMGFALLGSWEAILQQNSIWRHGFANALLFFAGVLLMAGLMHWVPRAIKRRITWPRTGYVAYNLGGPTAKSKKIFWTVMIVVVVFSAANGAIVAYLTRLLDPGSSGPHRVVLGGRQDWINFGWIGVAPLYVAIYGWLICRNDRNHPWKWLVLLFMALELFAIAVVAPGDFAALGRTMLLATGLTWIASGGVTLYLFVRHTQRPAEAIE
jgi:hypothetical protein